ncbi:MAG: protein kinase [Myxococcales bacterium]|nr:protein kinase [Myxococcales bacterium]
MIPGSADPKTSQAQPSWVVGPSIPAASRLGQVIDGEFLIKGVLGQGELGVTYEAENSRLKRKFAVLMLKRELKPTHEMMLAVRNDLRRAQQLGAAGLMPVKMLADRDGVPGFATELLEGETLRARLNRGPLRAERALAIILSIARTLEAAHKVGLVHGDLRPENIFLVRPGAKNSSAGKVMVVEHALHHLRRRAAGLDDQLPLYKHLYRPPEQVAGMIGATDKGDVFVLGAILHECLTARPAFFAEEIEFILENLASPPPPLSANLATGLTPELAAALTLLIRHACALTLDERVPSMSELIEGLEQIATGYRLKLPEPPVEIKDEVTPAARPATAASENMSRLLQRMSGVFPQIALPPTGSPVGPASEPSRAPSPEASQPASAVRISGDAAASLPRLEPLQQERVSRILRKLSGAFPVIAPPASDAAPLADSKEPTSTDDRKLEGSTAAGPSATAAGAQREDRPRNDVVAAPSAVTPVPSLAAGLPAESALRSASQSLPATPDLVPTDPKAALPLLVDIRPAASAVAAVAPGPTASVAAPAAAAAPAQQASPDRHAHSPAPSLMHAAEPLATPASAVASQGQEPAAVAVAPSSAVPSLSAGSEASSAPTPAPSTSSVNSAPGVPSAVAQATTAPIVPSAPHDLDRPAGSAKLAEPEVPLPPTLVVPTPDLSGGIEAARFATAVASPSGDLPTRPRLEVSTELAVPPLPLGGTPQLLPAPVMLLPAAPPASSALAAGGNTASSFQSAALPAVPSPLSSAPTAVQLPRPGRLQHETTLAGDELAVIMEPSQPALPVPPPLPAPPALSVAVPPTPKPQDAPALQAEASRLGPDSDLGAMRTVAQLAAVTSSSTEPQKLAAEPAAPSGARTVSELATRPALAALAEKLVPLPQPLRINELPTQPAVRRLPITELATQARIPTAAGSSLDGAEPLSAALLEEAPPSFPPIAQSAAGPTASPTAATLGPSLPQTAVPSPLPATPGGAEQSGGQYMPPSTGPERLPSPPEPAAVASAVTVPERAPPPRPPRVSQLIAALQHQQGPLRPPPEPEPTPAPVSLPIPTGPKATGAQARGLMLPAPEALAAQPSAEAQSIASLSQPAVSPLAAPATPPREQTTVERMIDWALRHQELAAAGLGAVLVLLITLFYLALMR